MAKKRKSGSKHKSQSNRVPWDQMRGKIEKKKKRIKIAMISVLGVAAAAIVYLAAVIVFSDPPVAPSDEEKAAAEAHWNRDKDKGTPEPGVGDEGKPDEGGTPLAGDPEAVRDPEETAVSPLFKDGVVETGMKAIKRPDERNFLNLLTFYSEDLGEGEAREALKKIYRLTNEGEFAQALEETSNIKLGGRIQPAVRAILLTRLLKKAEAGEAYSMAASNTQPHQFHFEYGLYYLEAGNPSAAFKQFEIGTRKTPESAQLQFAAAASAFDLGMWDAVVKHVGLGAKAAKQMPVRFGLLAAESEARLGKPVDAIERCRTMLRADPAAYTAKLYLARVLAATGQFKESLRAYTELEKDMPKSQLIKVELVKAYMAIDDKEAALKLAGEFAESKSDDPRIQAWYADILASNERIEEARKILEGIRGELKANELAVLESIIAMRQNDFAAAAQALEPYHEEDPNLAIRWAAFKFREGKQDGEIQGVLEAHRLNAILWKVVATHAAKNSLWKMTAFCCDKAIALGDETVDTLNNWAWCAIQDTDNFDLERVVWACEQALSASPGNPDVLHTYGQALFKAGRAGRCGELFVKHREVVDTSPPLTLLQAQVYLALGAEPSARRYLQRTLELMEGATAWHLEMSREDIERKIAELPE